MSTAKLVRKRIEEVEENYGLNFGTIFLRLSQSRASAAIFQLSASTFRLDLPTGFGRRDLLEDLYHELGHAYRWRYGLNAGERNHFFSGRKIGMTPSDLINYHLVDRPNGFVSSYAITSQDEDFCETFSAYIANDGRISGTILYDGKRINLERDQMLKTKFKAIGKIISGLHEKPKRKKRDVRNEYTELNTFRNESVRPGAAIVHQVASVKEYTLDEIRAELKRIQEHNRTITRRSPSRNLKSVQLDRPLKGL